MVPILCLDAIRAVSNSGTGGPRPEHAPPERGQQRHADLQRDVDEALVEQQGRVLGGRGQRRLQLQLHVPRRAGRLTARQQRLLQLLDRLRLLGTRSGGQQASCFNACLLGNTARGVNRPAALTPPSPGEHSPGGQQASCFNACLLGNTARGVNGPAAAPPPSPGEHSPGGQRASRTATHRTASHWW